MGIIEIIKGFIALLFLQSSWSYQGRQTLGIIFTTIVLTKSKNAQSEPNQNQIKERIWQKISFNTNPYCTGLMVGIALNKQGEIFKESYFSLQHIFGAVGDEFFWRTFRPALLSLAILILLTGYLISGDFLEPGIFIFTPLVFLIPYNYVAQGVRFRGLYQGKKYGKQAAVFLVEKLRAPVSKLYNLLAFILGMLFILSLLIYLSFYRHPVSVGLGFIAGISIILLTALSYLTLRTERANSYLLIAGLLILLVFKVL